MSTHEPYRELIEIELENQRDVHDAERNDDVVSELLEISDGLEAMLELKEGDPSLESHDASFLCVNAQLQRLGLERAIPEEFRWSKITDVLKRIWQTIKSAVAETYALLKRIFIRLFTGFQSIKDRASSLRSKVQALPNDVTPGTVSVQAPRRLAYRKNVSFDGIRKGLGSLTAVGKSVHGDYLNAAVEFYNEFESFIGALRSSSIDAVDKSAERLQKPKVLDTLSGTSVMLNSVLLGDRQFQYSESHARKTEKSSAKIEGMVDLPTPPILSDVYDKTVTLRQLEMGALSKANMLVVLDDLSALATVCLQSRRSVDKIIDSRKKMMKDMDKVLAEKNRQGDVNSEDMTKLKRYIRSGMSTMQKILIRPISQHSTHSFNVSRSLLILVERSIAAHK